jgi:pilus assembly protein CpaB
MRAKTILSVLFLISLSVVAMLYLYSLPRQLNADGLTDNILVTARALAPGTLLSTGDVIWKRNTRALEPGQIAGPSSEARATDPELSERARADVYGATLRVGVSSGDPILKGNIIKPSDRDFLQIVLDPGRRAITIPLATGGASTHLMFPGDHVDVILTQIFKNDIPLTRRSVSETVVEDLRVLVVDRTNAKAIGAAGGLGRGVTLEVTPEEAEKINVATELGRLSLSLRGIGGAGGVTASSNIDVHKGEAVKPTWSGDVSPALSSAMPPPKVVAIEQPAIEIIHGTKRENVKF